MNTPLISDDDALLETLFLQPMFVGVGMADRDRLRTVTTLERVAAGTTIIVEDDPEPDALYALLRGEIAITREDRMLGLQRPPSMLGLLSLLDGNARTATLTAFTDAIIARIPRAAVLDVLVASKTMARNVLDSLTRDLRGMHRRESELKARFDDLFDSPNARLIPGPWTMPNAELSVFVMVGPVVACQRLLPDGVEVLGNGLGPWLLCFAFYPELKSPRSVADGKTIRFAEATPLIPVRTFDGRIGLFCPEAYPDNYLAVFLGRELHGLPRRIGELRRGEREIDLGVDQHLLLRASWTGITSAASSDLSDGVAASLARANPAANGEHRATLDESIEAFSRWVASGSRANVPILVRNQVPDVVASDGETLRIDELLSVSVLMEGARSLEILDGAAVRKFAHEWMLGGRCTGGFRLRADMEIGEARVLRRYDQGAE